MDNLMKIKFKVTLFVLILAIDPMTYIFGEEYRGVCLHHSELVSMIESQLNLVSSPRAIQTCWEGSKQYYLRRAKSARDDANDDLLEALSLMEGIFDSDVNEKKLLVSLISSFIGTSIIFQDVRVVLVGQALILIERLVDIVYVNYEKLSYLQRKLVSSAASLENSIFYSRMALGAPLYSEHYDYCDYFLKVSPLIEDAIQYLILVDMYIATLRNQFQPTEILDRVYQIREKMMSEIEKHGTIINVHSDVITGLMDGIYKITQGVITDIDAVHQILNLLSDTKKSLIKAEKILKENNVIKITKIPNDCMPKRKFIACRA